MDAEEKEKFIADLKGLPDNDIKARLLNHHYRGNKRTVAEQYLENRDLARHQRFTQRDRSIQKWILAVAILGLIVGSASLAATIFAFRF